MVAAAIRRTVLALLVAFAVPPDVSAACPERPACRGCGCKGGTGYRAPDGHCVGFREFDAVCGRPPHASCAFENAPGTGENRDCALAPRTRTRETPPPKTE